MMDNQENNTKKCSRCKKIKYKSFFTLRHNRLCGVYSRCKDCVAELAREKNALKRLNRLPKDPEETEEHKRCVKCKCVKHFSWFNKHPQGRFGLDPRCKACLKEDRKSKKAQKAAYDKIYNSKNKEKRKKQRQKRYQENKSKTIESNNKWRAKHPDKVRKRKQKWKNKKRMDRVFKLAEAVSQAIRNTLKTNGSSKGGNSVWAKLSYTPQQLKEHLESLWEPWMNWTNYGPADKNKRTWSIDHRKPQKLLPFDSLDHCNFIECWSLSNLTPLDSRENSSKRDKYEF